MDASHAVSHMGSSGRDVIPALLVNLKDEDGLVRRGAVSALESIGSDEDSVIAALDAALETDPDRLVRRDAAYALGYLGSPRGIPSLQDALQDPDSEVREAAKEALNRVKEKSRPRE
jgi:HEAT repeat protein